MSFPQGPLLLAARLPKVEALRNIEMLQNLMFLIEHQADLSEETREHVKTMQSPLDDLTRHLLSSASKLRTDRGLILH